MNIFRKLDRLSDFLLSLAGMTCLALPVIILAVVVIRSINPSGMPLWSIDICELLMWGITYLGMGMVWRLGKHVAVDVLVKNLPPRIGRIREWAIPLLLMFMSLILLAGGLRVCLDSWLAQKKTTNEFPEYFLSTAIPAGLAFLVYELGRSLWKRTHCSASPAERIPSGH